MEPKSNAVQTKWEKTVPLESLGELKIPGIFDDKKVKEALSATVLEAYGKFLKMGIRMGIVLEWENKLEIKLTKVE